MEIYFDTVLIAEDSLGAPYSGFAIPVALVVDPVAYSGADAIDPYSRDAANCQIAGTVQRQFGSHEDAVAFYALHHAQLPKRGTLYWKAGGVTKASATAVRSLVVTDPPQGVNVQVSYTFIAGLPA